jgi:hypothetical protein
VSIHAVSAEIFHTVWPTPVAYDLQTPNETIVYFESACATAIYSTLYRNKCLNTSCVCFEDLLQRKLRTFGNTLQQNNLRSVTPILFKTVSSQGSHIGTIYGRKFHITFLTLILIKIRTDVEWQRRVYPTEEGYNSKHPYFLINISEQTSSYFISHPTLGNVTQ